MVFIEKRCARAVGTSYKAYFAYPVTGMCYCEQEWNGGKSNEHYQIPEQQDP